MSLSRHVADKMNDITSIVQETKTWTKETDLVYNDQEPFFWEFEISLFIARFSTLCAAQARREYGRISL